MNTAWMWIMGCVVCLCDMNPQCLLLQTSTHLTWTQGWQRTTCPGQFSIVFPQDRFHGCCEWRDNQRLVHDKTSLPIPTQYVPHIYCEFRSLTLKFYSQTFQQSSGQFGGLSLKCIYFKATRSTWFFQEDQPLNRAQKNIAVASLMFAMSTWFLRASMLNPHSLY